MKIIEHALIVMTVLVVSRAQIPDSCLEEYESTLISTYKSTDDAECVTILATLAYFHTSFANFEEVFAEGVQVNKATTVVAGITLNNEKCSDAAKNKIKKCFQKYPKNWIEFEDNCAEITVSADAPDSQLDVEPPPAQIAPQASEASITSIEDDPEPQMNISKDLNESGFSYRRLFSKTESAIRRLLESDPTCVGLLMDSGISAFTDLDNSGNKMTQISVFSLTGASLLGLMLT